MATSPNKQSLRTFLADTVTLLCKNFLQFESEFSVEGLIGITLDQKDVFLISIHETVKSPDAAKVPAPKSADAECFSPKLTPESKLTAKCNVSLPQGATSVEDVVKPTVVSQDSIVVDISHDADIARQPVVMLPDDIIKGDDAIADVKLEVGSTRSLLPEQAHDRKLYDRDLSSSEEQLQNSVALPSAFDSHMCLETTTCDDLKTFDKLDYSENSVRGEGRSVHQSSVVERSTSDCRRLGFSESGDFEVIEIKEESLSEDELWISNPNSHLGLPPSQPCSQDYGIGTSSAMDTTLGMGYSYWEGNPITSTTINGRRCVTISVSSSAPNPGGVPIKSGPKTRNSTIYVSSSAPIPGGVPVKKGPKTKKSKFYECQKCSIKLTTAHSLKEHETVVHQGNYKYTCHLCGKGLRTEYNLRGHMASRHNMSKDYRCTMCMREFGYRHTLRDHMVACHGVTASFDLDNSGLAT